MGGVEGEASGEQGQQRPCGEEVREEVWLWKEIKEEWP